MDFAARDGGTQGGDGTPSRDARVLIVDDEENLADLLAMAARLEGLEAATAADGPRALDAFRAGPPDLVVLDVMLPGTDGVTLLRKFRDLQPDVPVLMLTAKAAVSDRIAGLAAGADDYVTKPFSLEEVVLRMRALLRRSGWGDGPGDTRITVGDLHLDTATHEVWRGSRTVDLTHTEYKLLLYLMRHPRQVLSKRQILSGVWDRDFTGRASVVELYVSYLRRKIDSDPSESMIQTVRGVGYALRPPP
ncbi:response regulator transcription factor [Salininema proteolyticum]|uniref:Response regulator transcription factor n=1 Tax=Salininema proteolyticum TaxID=1607685 RepID=A0ABV8U4J0_9ACTN